MSIWHYEAERLGTMSPEEVANVYQFVGPTRVCEFCKVPLDAIKEYFTDDEHALNSYRKSTGRKKTTGLIGMFEEHSHLRAEQFLLKRPNITHDRRYHQTFEERFRICPNCGWWVAFKETIAVGEAVEVNSYGGVGALRILDLTDVKTPIDEVRQYLAARYDARFQINPQLFEETVASVFRDLGYSARVTAYSGDDGIDVILDGAGGDTIGVQVKRYRDKIKVFQIRELTGALVINGLTRGIFLTTSEFQSGAQRTADMSSERGLPVELIDAARFYDALKLAQRERYKKGDRLESFFQSFEWVQLGSRSSDGEDDVDVWM